MKVKANDTVIVIAGKDKGKQGVDPKTGEATRVGYQEQDGKRVRVAKKSGEVIAEAVSGEEDAE